MWASCHGEDFSALLAHTVSQDSGFAVWHHIVRSQRKENMYNEYKMFNALFGALSYSLFKFECTGWPDARGKLKKDTLPLPEGAGGTYWDSDAGKAALTYFEAGLRTKFPEEEE